ncbi:intraflagellar transport protein 43 homolog isoform X2 [Mizuhopecten yessoensis]|uniref:intraflagellar transport protein 43 homolog isoform X2 n=1 Tax=Mizuhopecten yessoensis TaxID=6573 RepID=UPI000B45EE56|nr:intraflagellar transport protein 43 homolog isoform X2 [Mizuhopecten yessoensis]
MDDDLSFENTTASKSSRSAKQGRRAQSKGVSPPDAPAFEDESPRSTKPPKKSSEETDGPPKPSRVSGWGEDAPRKSRKLGEGFEQFDDKQNERLRPKSPDNDSDNEIPVIPDLEDQQDDDMTSTIAVAPNVAVNRVATYRELDNDLLRQAAFLTLDNEIDLKLLTKSLSAEADLVEVRPTGLYKSTMRMISPGTGTDYSRRSHPKSCHRWRTRRNQSHKSNSSPYEGSGNPLNNRSF